MGDRLALLGREFEGFQKAVGMHVAAWDGSEVDQTWLSLPELEHTMLRTDACDRGSFDLAIVPADWLPALAAAGAVRDLRPFLADCAPDGWPDAWAPSFHAGLEFRQGVWGLPFHDGPQLLFTRTDLYADDEERRRYWETQGAELQPAATWDEFTAQIRWFTRQPEWFGTVLAGAPDGHNNVYDFVVQLWRHGGDVLRGGEITLDAPPSYAALASLRDLFINACPPEAHALDSVQSGERYASGGVATMLNWAGFAAFGRASGSPVEGKVRCSLAPAGTTTVNAFWVSVITSGAGCPELAYRYLTHTTSPRMDKATTQAGACGARYSTWDDPDILACAPEHGLFRDAHRHSRPLWRVTQLPAIVRALNTLVEKVIWEGQDAEIEVPKAASEISLLLEGQE